MTGPFLIFIGLGLLWVAFRGKSPEALKALDFDQLASKLGTFLSGLVKVDSQQPSNSTGGSSNSSNSNKQNDSGTHQGIDANGNIITINKSYGDMSDAEKDAANAFAHKFPGGH